METVGLKEQRFFVNCPVHGKTMGYIDFGSIDGINVTFCTKCLALTLRRLGLSILEIKSEPVDGA